MHNLRSALRSLAKSPGFTAVALLTLALGIGFSTSSFSFANTFLLRDVPYPEASRLVRIYRTSRQSSTRPLAPANMLELRETATSFSGWAIFNGDNYSFGEAGQPAEQVFGMAVTADFLDVLRAKPMLGRGFVTGEDQPDKPLVVVITQRAWVRRFGSDPTVIGRSVRLNSQLYTIVGVLPESFEATLVWGPVEFIIPRTLVAEFRTQRTSAWMNAVARLKPGVSLRQAQTELDTLAARLAQQYPKENAGDGLRVVDLHDSNMDKASRNLLWLMTGLSLTMLLIGCANLASLQVARAFSRLREFAVRAAIGGAQRQLMAPLLAESFILSLGGGLLGLLVASWTNDIIGSLLIINGDPGFNIPLDARVFGFAAFGSVLSGLAFGLTPAWIASRSPASEALKEGSRSATASKSHRRLKRVLIVGELALTLALVGGAMAFGVGSRAFFRRELGWQIDGLFTGYFALPFNRYQEEARVVEFERALIDRLSVLPGVEHAALTTSLPIFSLGGTRGVVVEGQPAAERGKEPIAEKASVSAALFKALQIPLKEGALFSPGLKREDPPVAIVNEAFARRFWPGQSAVGRRVRLVEDQDWVQIVGVVGDVKMAVRADTPETRLHYYRPLVQSPSRYVTIVLRTNMPPETLATPVRQAVAALDADMPVAQAGSLRTATDRMQNNVNLVIVNLGISAAMGLLIAAVGLFGVISQLTAQRTRDIGVRIALGASRTDILRMILGEGAVLLATGIVAGVPLYFAMTSIVGRAVPEVTMPGVWLLAANVGVLALTMMAACFLPAQRATRVDPIEALRTE